MTFTFLSQHKYQFEAKFASCIYLIIDEGKLV